MAWKEGYIRFIENELQVIDKNNDRIDFKLNPIQMKYASEDSTGMDIVLKARQQGFSSLILARFTADFLLKENSQSVVVADLEENAEILLDRVKMYIKTYEQRNGIKVPLKYNSKNQLFNEALNSRYTIGTAKATEFGRSRTITNLHLSEAAFYPNLSKILAGAGNALTPNGYLVIETTANGFNEFKQLWDACKRKEEAYAPLFYPASAFYDDDFLTKKGKNNPNNRLYRQEYPESDLEAFLTSGDVYFDTLSLEWYLTQCVKQPMQQVSHV